MQDRKDTLLNHHQQFLKYFIPGQHDSTCNMQVAFGNISSAAQQTFLDHKQIKFIKIASIPENVALKASVLPLYTYSIQHTEYADSTNQNGGRTASIQIVSIVVSGDYSIQMRTLLSSSHNPVVNAFVLISTTDVSSNKSDTGGRSKNMRIDGFTGITGYTSQEIVDHSNRYFIVTMLVELYNSNAKIQSADGGKSEGTVAVSLTSTHSIYKINKK